MLQYSNKIVGYLNFHPRKKKKGQAEMVLANMDKSFH